VSRRYLPAVLLVALLTVLRPAASQANPNVCVSRFWHVHQPIYWPEWNSSSNSQPNRVQFAKDSMVLKAGQVYDSGQAHPDNDLDQIFGVDDRKKAYQDGPKNSLANVNTNGGYAMSYSGSLINNVQSLGNTGYSGYSSGWWNGNRTARTWLTPLGTDGKGGNPRLDLVGFTYHHSLGSVLPKSVFRKEIQIFHEAAYKAWNTGNITNRSKGFFPTEMAFSRTMVDVLADEGYQWVIVASHHLSRTLPGYMGNPQYTMPESNSWKIFSSPPNKADQIGSTTGGGWWFGTGNVGETAYNHSPYAYQLHKAKYVNPETGAEKTIIMVPSDDIQSYKAGYSGWQKGLIDDSISPYASNPARPCIVMPSTDGDNAWGGGSSSWDGDAPSLMNNGTYPGVAVQDFVNRFGPAADTVHVEDGAWIFPESDYGSPQFLKWVEPPAGGQTNSRVPNTQVDMETPGFTPKFYSWAPVMAGANWCETAEQMWTDENGAGSVQAWKIQDPYDNLSASPAYSNPNIVERAWHVYLAGLDSGFNYYGGEGNDDEVKSSLATRRAYELLSSYVDARKGTNDRTPPTVFKPQRFPYNPGGYTFGWFNIVPGNGNALKKMNSEFYVWTHAYDVSGITNIVAKIRVDNDGTNPIASNQNETYAGGAEVGSWVQIPMTKRVLPQTAAALTAAANNSKIAYFEGARSPVVADYYFARIDNASLANFRGKLLDYYIEATDARGNVSQSDIQHVFAEDDGQTPAAPAKVTGVSATGLTTSSIRVAWSAVPGATGYKVSRGVTQIGNPTGLSFDDTGLAEDTSYSYTVVANNAVGDGPASDPVPGRTLAFIDSNPAALLVTAPMGPAGVASNVTTFTFTGQAGALLTNGIFWTNLLTSQGGSFVSARDWSLNVPLGPGPNGVVFSASHAISGTQTNGSDSPTNASYAGGWTNSSTGGIGFGAWALSATANAGHFLADNSTNLSTGLTKGFGLWANGGGVSTARRAFNTNLDVGGKINVRFDNNWIDNGGAVGLALADAGNTNRFSFFFTGGQANYRASDATTNRDTGIAYTSTGLDLSFELTASNAYRFTAGTNVLTGTLAAGGPIAQLVVSNSSAGTNTDRNLYLGAISLTSLLNSSGTVTTNAPVVTRASGGTTDGLPNNWWNVYFPNPSDWVAADDNDRDGFTNAEEFALGTDPANPGSRFAVDAASQASGVMTVTWDSVPGKKYRLQVRPSLTAGTWQDVGSDITATGATTSTTHDATGQSFYRVRLVP
jgi:hypothetical protein